ncbi:dockerin type I repeat-containing protein [Ruminococcus sp.]
MELSWKKYAAAVTAAVCLLVPFSDTVIAGAADGGGFGWGNAADGFIADTEWASWGTPSNGSTGPWGDQNEIKEDEVSLYVTETPDPTEEELKADHISGQRGAMVYNIDKKSGENAEFTFSSGTQDGFRASWSGLEALRIEKGKSFKKPVNIAFFGGLSVDYKVIFDNFTGDQLDIGARCQLAGGDDYLYIVDHFGSFEPDEDMEELEPLDDMGKIYQVYKKERTEKDRTYKDYYLVYVRDIEEISAEPDLRASAMVKDAALLLGQSYDLPPVLSCCFYMDTYGGDGAVDVSYIMVNSRLMSGLAGMSAWNANVWGNYEGNAEDSPCTLYPDEDGYYFFNDGTQFYGSGFGNGTDITLAEDFGRDDKNSVKVECSNDYFLGEPSERYLAYIGNVGYPFKKGIWGEWGNTQQTFGFGPIYPADEDYVESDVSYDISVEVYNNSDEEAEFSLEISMPMSGFGISDEDNDKIRKYEGNVVCKKTVKPHEWTTLSNPSYAMPRALTGNLIMYTDSEIEYYVDNIAVKEPEDVSKIRGDINGDGVIDLFDLIQYRRALMISGSEKILPRRADIDGDENVLINDVVLLKKFLLGIDKELAVKEKNADDKRESGEKSGRYYKSFVGDGVGELTYDIGENGCFDCKISDADEACFECGTAPEDGIKPDGVKSLYYVYEGEIASEDGYLFGIHGTFAESPDEFCIIEDSGHDRRFAGRTAAKTVNIEGYCYRIYILNRIKETPEGKVRYKEFWSVMDDYRLSGKALTELRGQINILKHISSWENICGLKLGSRTLGSVGLYVGGSKQYSQSFRVSRNELFIGVE